MNQTFNNLSIMYVTCETYRNLWDSFFKLKNKYINDGIKTFFCTDILPNDFVKPSKNTIILNYNVKSIITAKNGNLYDRYLYYLNNIDSEFILYFYDDMHPTKKVDIKKIEKIVQIMKNDDSIDIVKLSLSSYPFKYGEHVIINNMKFIKASNKDSYIMNLQPMIIRKNTFIDIIKYTKNRNNIHQNGGIEIFGTNFLRSKNNKSLRVVNEIVSVFGSGGLVRSGILSNDAKKWLESENIHIKTYDNNLIFKLTKKEYNYIPKFFHNFHKKNGIQI